MTQKELARRIGTTNVKISRFENGIDIPKADILKRLAEELDVTMDYLIEGMETSPHIERKQMG